MSLCNVGWPRPAIINEREDGSRTRPGHVEWAAHAAEASLSGVADSVESSNSSNSPQNHGVEEAQREYSALLASADVRTSASKRAMPPIEHGQTCCPVVNNVF